MSVEGNASSTYELRGKLSGVFSNIIDNTLSIEGAGADAKATGDAIKAHNEDKNNPHGVTAAQVGARPNTWMPTAAQVGALPTTGGTMTGTLRVHNGYLINTMDQTGSAYLTGYKNGAFVESCNTEDYVIRRHLRLSNPINNPDINTALVIAETLDGMNWTAYYVLHAGNIGSYALTRETARVLWTNASPTSSFATQTLTISGLTNSTCIVIVLNHTDGDNFFHIAHKNVLETWASTPSTARNSDGTGFYTAHRAIGISFDAGVITFGDGYQNGTLNNNKAIPIAVISLY